VIGNGAREDALSWRLAQSPSCSAMFAAPGNAGTATRGSNWPIAATDGKALLARAREEAIDLVVLGPETAIAAGVGDRMREAKFATFGPNRSAGRLESSKVFSKRFMERHRIPTAKARVVRSLANAQKALAEWRGGCVVNAVGLAAEGERYVGVLYCGLMWTSNGPYVIEFNVRFGDPETQVLMPRVRGDFARSLKSAADGAFDEGAATFDGRTCVGVVLATSDYPRSSTPLRDLSPDVALADGRVAFWGASTQRQELAHRIGAGVSLSYRRDIADLR